jgi:hypothetical protein
LSSPLVNPAASKPRTFWAAATQLPNGNRSTTILARVVELMRGRFLPLCDTTSVDDPWTKESRVRQPKVELSTIGVRAGRVRRAPAQRHLPHLPPDLPTPRNSAVQRKRTIPQHVHVSSQLPATVAVLQTVALAHGSSDSPTKGRPVVLGLGEPPFRYLNRSPHPRYNFRSHGFDALSQLQHCLFACKDGSF